MALPPSTVYGSPEETPEECATIQEALIDTAIQTWDTETVHTYQLPVTCSARAVAVLVQRYERAGWRVLKSYTDAGTTQGWLLSFSPLVEA